MESMSKPQPWHPINAAPRMSYPAIESHGVIGDRRTAALVTSDGTIDWLCLPDYDGNPFFAAILDAKAGGFWRLGPAAAIQGRQEYHPRTACLTTTWDFGRARLELLDAMVWPESERPLERRGQRVLVRRLRATKGMVHCELALRLSRSIAYEEGEIPAHDPLSQDSAILWTNRPFQFSGVDESACFDLSENEELWAVLTSGDGEPITTVTAARQALANTIEYWQRWSQDVIYTGPRQEAVLRSAITTHLLGYAPKGSLVAAPTTSLPERIGGQGNWDYRYAWIRDASLSLAILSLLGPRKEATRYMDWLAGLGSNNEMPLQVMYGIRGETQVPEQELKDLEGYRGSSPVRIGNRAFEQFQLDSLGYFVDCAFIYFEQGGEWKAEYWNLIERIADFVSQNWKRKDNGIWELPELQHYVSSKVMSWVALERTTRLAEKLGHTDKLNAWKSVMTMIHEEVMARGWSEKSGSFRQCYGAEGLDASALLISVMGFLKPDHPRVLATMEHIASSLMIDGFVYRFDPLTSPGGGNLPLGEAEGAFLPCTFWLATAYAKAGEPDKAEVILRRAEEIAGLTHLFAEEADPRLHCWLGNTPLLFSQIEYVRAVMETAKKQPLQAARMMIGKGRLHLRRMTQALSRH